MDRRTEGPMAELMAEAGFSPDAIRRSGESFAANFLDPGTIGHGIMAEDAARAFVRTFRDVALRLEDATRLEDRFVVEVAFTDRTVVDGAFAEETIDFEILATSEAEATFTAAQLAATAIDVDCTGELMVIATRITSVSV